MLALIREVTPKLHKNRVVQRGDILSTIRPTKKKVISSKVYKPAEQNSHVAEVF